MKPSIEILVASALAVLLACVTVTATPGIESAAVLGVLLPPVIAGANARRVARARREGTHDKDRSLALAVVRASLAFLVVIVVALGRLALEPACFDASGLAWLVLGPLPGMLLAALVGEAVGRIVDRPRLAAAAAVLVPVLAYVVVAWEIHSTPAVFVFTIFGGHWPGPIYDESRTLPEAFLSYRLVTMLAIASIGLVLRFGPRRSGFPRFGALVVALACAIGFAFATTFGAELGHRTSVARIDEALGGRYVGDRCVLHVPSEMPYRERRRLLAECEAHVVDVERILHVRRGRPLEAFVYRSSEEKASLVGAGDTYVAKPWRGEVHVQRESFPHEVLRHEIVHVIAASLGPWPFRTSGSLGGAWMNPGLVEGLAVAVAWDERDDLSPDEWSAAMLELGQLPRARSLFGSGFLGQGASASYAAAGSFVAHLLRTRGADAVGAMYLHGSVGDPATIAREERAWHTYLRTRVGTASERALALVRVRLLDRGLLSTRCGRLRARISDSLVDASRHHDFGRAMRRCGELLAIDSRDAIARVNHAVLLARAGSIESAERELSRMPETEVPGALRARLRTVIGDAIVRRGGSIDAARAHFREALAIPQDEDMARALEVRLLGLDRPADERYAILEAVVEPSRDARSEVEIGARLALVASTAHDGLAAYLLARRLFNDGRTTAAMLYLERAMAMGAMPTDRLEQERERLVRRVLFARALEGDEGAANRIRELVRTHGVGGQDDRFATFERYLQSRTAHD